MTDWYAIATGDISAPGVWSKSPSGAVDVLAWGDQVSGDNFYANGLALEIIDDISLNIGSGKLSTEAGAGTAGGSFTISYTNVMTCEIAAGTTPCLVTGAGTYTVTINGGVTGGTATSAYGINRTVAGATFIINVPAGKFIAGGAGPGTGSAGLAHGFYSHTTATSGTVTINSIVPNATIVKGATGGNFCQGIFITATATLIINGGVVGGSGASTSSCSGVRYTTGNLTITGDIVGGSGTSGGNNGVSLVTAGTIVLNSNITSGTGNYSNYGLYRSNSTGTVTLTGNIVNNSVCPAIAGPITYTPAAGNYIEYPDATGTRKYYYDIPEVENVLSTDTVAGVTGGYVLTVPTTPVITSTTVVTDDVTVAITGNAGATHICYYRLNTATAWTASGTRVGNGNITLSNLAAGRYYIIAVSSLSGSYSLPSLLTTFGVATSDTDSLWELALYDVLQADATVESLVSTKIYNSYAPPTKGKPYIIYSQISGPRDQTFDGPSGLATIHIQINMFASTYAASRQISEAVKFALDGYENLSLTLSNGNTVKILETKLTDEGDVPTEQSDTIVVYGKRQDYEMVIDERP